MTIDLRARYFRNQVVAVVVVTVGSVVWAIAIQSLLPSVGILVIVPLCTVFFCLDVKVVDGWRIDLLKLWTSGQIEFAALCAAIRADPLLPKETTEGMLRTLPSADSLIAEQRVLPPTRRTIAAEVIATHRVRAAAMLAKASVTIVAAALIVLIVWLGN